MKFECDDLVYKLTKIHQELKKYKKYLNNLYKSSNIANEIKTKEYNVR